MAQSALEDARISALEMSGVQNVSHCEDVFRGLEKFSAIDLNSPHTEVDPTWVTLAVVTLLSLRTNCPEEGHIL